jgi:hypothetical protein
MTISGFSEEFFGWVSHFGWFLESYFGLDLIIELQKERLM